jgi:glutathione S-transferase
LAQNPLGKVPTLVRDDGPALYDSRVICCYLDALGKGALYPAAPRLWDALTLEATGDGIADASLLMVYETRVRPEEIRFAPWVEAQWAKVVRALDALEQRWLPYLAGPFDIGQAAVICGLGHVGFRHGARDWRSGHPGVAAWFERLAERPSVAATAPRD